jgi:hypothetical protein
LFPASGRKRERRRSKRRTTDTDSTYTPSWHLPRRKKVRDSVPELQSWQAVFQCPRGIRDGAAPTATRVTRRGIR